MRLKQQGEVFWAVQYAGVPRRRAHVGEVRRVICILSEWRETLLRKAEQLGIVRWTATVVAGRTWKQHHVCLTAVGQQQGNVVCEEGC